MMSVDALNNPKLLQQLHKLDRELEDGEITQKGYDKRKAAIMALHQKKNMTKIPKLNTSPLYRAAVSATTDAAVTVKCLAAIGDDSIMVTLKQYLREVIHPETPAPQVKSNLFLAIRRIHQVVNPNEKVLAYESPEHHKQQMAPGGVQITRHDSGSTEDPPRHVQLGPLLEEMASHFKVKYTIQYDNARAQTDVTFDGLAHDTAAAAPALEIVYNLLAEEACKLERLQRKKGSIGGGKQQENGKSAGEDPFATQGHGNKVQTRFQQDRQFGRSGTDRTPISVDKDESNENMVDVPSTDESERDDTNIADDGDEWNGFGDDEADTDADERTILFRKMIKRVAASVFKDGVVGRNDLVGAINEELMDNQELGAYFNNAEVDRIFDPLVFLDVFDGGHSESHVKLTTWMRQQLFGHPGDSGINDITPLSDNNQITAMHQNGETTQGDTDPGHVAHARTNSQQYRRPPANSLVAVADDVWDRAIRMNKNKAMAFQHAGNIQDVSRGLGEPRKPGACESCRHKTRSAAKRGLNGDRFEAECRQYTRAAAAELGINWTNTCGVCRRFGKKCQ